MDKYDKKKSKRFRSLKKIHKTKLKKKMTDISKIIIAIDIEFNSISVQYNPINIRHIECMYELILLNNANYNDTVLLFAL